MTKKRKTKKGKSNFKKEFTKELKDIEKWTHERKRFFKKLGWVIVLITLLIILSNLFLKVTGIGI